MTEQRIAVFGASFEWGAWDHEKHGWVTRLQLSLEKNKDENYIEVLNFGISGDTTVGLLQRLDTECYAAFKGHSTTYYDLGNNCVIIADIGGNDSALIKGKNFVEFSEFKKNIEKIYNIAKKYTNKIAFTGPKLPDKRAENFLPEHDYRYTRECTEKYFNAVKEFCKKNKILFIDVEKAFARCQQATACCSQHTEEKELLEDGLHPNAKGHQLMAEVVEKTLRAAKYI